MSVRAACVGLLISTLPAAGCGTVANLTTTGADGGHMEAFGGVKHDEWCIQKAMKGDIGPRANHGSEMEQYPQALLVLICAADLPLSAVGDLLTWPYTMGFNCVNAPVPASRVIAASPPVPKPLPTQTPPVAP